MKFTTMHQKYRRMSTMNFMQTSDLPYSHTSCFISHEYSKTRCLFSQYYFHLIEKCHLINAKLILWKNIGTDEKVVVQVSHIQYEISP